MKTMKQISRNHEIKMSDKKGPKRDGKTRFTTLLATRAPLLILVSYRSPQTSLMFQVHVIRPFVRAFSLAPSAPSAHTRMYVWIRTTGNCLYESICSVRGLGICTDCSAGWAWKLSRMIHVYVYQICMLCLHTIIDHFLGIGCAWLDSSPARNVEPETSEDRVVRRRRLLRGALTRRTVLGSQGQSATYVHH